MQCMRYKNKKNILLGKEKKKTGEEQNAYVNEVMPLRSLICMKKKREKRKGKGCGLC
jgi:hypothetical protein